MPSTVRPSAAGRLGKQGSGGAKLSSPRASASITPFASPSTTTTTTTTGSVTPHSTRLPSYSPRSVQRRPPYEEAHPGFTNATGGFFDGSATGGGSSTRLPGRASPNASKVNGEFSPSARGGGSWLPAPAGILPELAVSPHSRAHPVGGGGVSRPHRDRRNRHGGGPSYNGGSKGNSLVPSPPPPGLSLINSVAGDSLLFSETNMDWTKLNIFRTRLCDRLTQTHSCHMANRCLFSHDVNWPRRTPFLPRATALTLRYIPVWCPRLDWPPLVGLCESSGKISWTSANDDWDARVCHQNCTRGDNCPFVHNLEEFLYHPEVYKTRSCCLANDDNFDEQISNNCVALCPWYFCPFAHDVYELRDLRAARYAWHPPPQIVDNQFVARTQGFDDLELRIIDFIRKAPNGSHDLYSSPLSPLKRLWRSKLPPVIRPIPGSSLELLVPSASHQKCQFNDQITVMVLASFLNVLLYPVENFYVPTLLSLQCAIVQHQLGLSQESGTHQLDCATLLREFDCAENEGRLESTSAERLLFTQPSNNDHATRSPSFCLGRGQSDRCTPTGSSSRHAALLMKQISFPVNEHNDEERFGTPENANNNGGSSPCGAASNHSSVTPVEQETPTEDLQAILNLLRPEDLLQMMALISSNSAAAQGDTNTGETTEK